MLGTGGVDVSGLPRLSKGGRERWEKRLHRLNGRMPLAMGRPILHLEDVDGRADVASRGEFRWMEVDFTWLFHRANMQGQGAKTSLAVAVYVLGTLYARTADVHLPDPLVGRALRILGLPLEPAQTFATSLNPLDPLRVATEPQARVFGLALGYGAD